MIKEKYSADFPSEVINEGKVQVLVPKLEAYSLAPSDYAPSKAPVFYNPVMEFNRDLSVLALKAYQHLVNHEISVCEPLASQGIRGIRFAAEVEGVSKVLLSDINMRAYQLAKYNIKLNKLENVITLKHRDANWVLSSNASPKKRFDVIDIDPFGTPVPFLDSAFRALKNRGLLSATATDLAPLCGVHVKACLRKYGGKPLRTEYCHELAVRLLAGCMASMAAKHDVGIQILFSQSSDHYIRVYAQVFYGCRKADESLKNTGYVLHCFNCLHRETSKQPFVEDICPECGVKMEYAGPLWISNILNKNFVEDMICENDSTAFRNSAKITNLLTMAKGEASASIFYYVLDKLSEKVNLPTPSVYAFLEALRNRGYQAAVTHFNQRAIKTNAPALIMHEILREIVEK